MRMLLKFFAVLSLMFCLGASAATVAEVKQGLLDQLVADGYLTQEVSKEVAGKYIVASDGQESLLDKGGSMLGSFMSWMNMLRIVAVGLLLFAVSGYIGKFIKYIWHIIEKVPAIIYQGMFLLASLMGLVFAKQIWQSQAFYIALFCAFSTIIVLGWIVGTYEEKLLPILKKLSFGLPVSVVGCAWGMVYFGVLAIVYSSSTFGFFAAVCLSGMLSFTMVYLPGTLWLVFKEEKLASMVVGHLLVLVAYVGLWKSGLAPQELSYFHGGLQYYCTIALGTGLLVGASPFYNKHRGVYVVLFLALIMVAMAAYFMLNLTVISTLIMVFGLLFVLEWVGYMGYKSGFLGGCLVASLSIGALSFLGEKYGALLLSNLY